MEANVCQLGDSLKIPCEESTYENNGDYREYHYCFALFLGRDGLVPIHACFQDVCLLLLEV